MNASDEHLHSDIETHTRRFVSQIVLARLHALVKEYRQDWATGNAVFRIILVVGACVAALILTMFLEGYFFQSRTLSQMPLAERIQVLGARSQYEIRCREQLKAYFHDQPENLNGLYHTNTAATLAVTIVADGSIEKVVLSQSSGDAAFDHLIAGKLATFGKFERFSESMKLGSGRLTLPFRIGLTAGAINASPDDQSEREFP